MDVPGSDAAVDGVVSEGNTNAKKGDAHEQWIAARFSDSDDPLAHALLPEAALSKKSKPLSRHPDGKTGKADLSADSDLADFKISAKAAKGTGSLNQIERTWLSKLFPGQSGAKALAVLGSMCGSVDGKEILPRSVLRSPSSWHSEELEAVQAFVESQRLMLASKALGSSAGITHVVASFMDVGGQDIHVSLEAAKFARWLAGNKDGERWCSVSPKGSALWLGPAMIMKRKGGDKGGKGGNNVQVALRMDAVWRAANAGQLPGARIWREPRTRASVAMESEDPSAWSAAWLAEKAGVFASEEDRLGKLVEERASSELRPRARAFLVEQMRATPAIFQRAWISGAVGEGCLEKARGMKAPGPYGAVWRLAEEDWKLALSEGLRIKEKWRKTESARVEEGVSAEAGKARARSRRAQVESFADSVEKVGSGKKLMDTMGSIWKAFSVDSESIAAARSVILAGFNPQKLLGSANLDDAEREASRKRVVAWAAKLAEGYDLKSALASVGGELVERKQFKAGEVSRKVRGALAKTDEVMKLASEISLERGWAPCGKSEVLLRAVMRHGGLSDQALMAASVRAGLGVQKTLSNWSSGGPQVRARMRIKMGALCEAKPALLAAALEHGERDIEKKHGFKDDMKKIARDYCAREGHSWSGWGVHVMAALRGAGTQERSKRVLESLRLGLTIDSLRGWGRLDETAREAAYGQLELFCGEPDALVRSKIRNTMDGLTGLARAPGRQLQEVHRERSARAKNA